MKKIDNHVILNRFIIHLFSCSNLVLLPTRKLCQERMLPTITNIRLIYQMVRLLLSYLCFVGQSIYYIINYMKLCPAG